MKYFNLLIILLSVSNCYELEKKKNDESKLDHFQKIELEVLIKDKIGKVFVYDLVKSENCNKSNVKYLGIVNKEYKIVTSFFVSGNKYNCRGRSAIRIYDLKNKYFGEYYIGMPEDLPDSLNDNKLFFSQKNSICDKRKDFTISLENELPKEIFIPCTEKGGDFYSLDKEHR